MNNIKSLFIYFNIVYKMVKNINSMDNDSVLYEKTIARIRRSNDLYKVLYGKEVEFIEGKTFRKFYKLFK